MDEAAITIKFHPQTGSFQIQHPDNVFLALGMLEFAKAQVLAEQQTQQQPASGLVLPRPVLPAGIGRK